MNWIKLESLAQLQNLIKASANRPQVIFKHSTRCSISAMVFHRLDKEETPAGADFYYLDLIAHRDISNQIAEGFQVFHESPQILVIKNGECIYDESHHAIMMDELLEQLN
jgi:bacillithiol system protein YtxJ